MNDCSRLVLVSLVVAIGAAGCCFPGSSAPAPATTAAPITPPTAVPPAAPTLAVGAPVLAAWRAGRFWFAGVVVGTEGASYVVLYADGTSEVVPAANVTDDHLGPGVAIDAHQSGETDFVHATVVDRIGHAVRVRYDDGHQMWTSIGLVRVDSEGVPPSLPAWTPAPPVPGTTATGAQVLARFEDGFLYSAVVIDPGPTGAMRVLYADGDGEEITPDRVLPDTLAAGSSVQALDRAASAVLPATVTRRIQHAVEVTLADGSTRWFALANVRLAPPTP